MLENEGRLGWRVTGRLVYLRLVYLPHSHNTHAAASLWANGVPSRKWTFGDIPSPGQRTGSKKIYTR